ncbi:serine/threonine protein kinase [Pseudobutyrivibrio sp.]|uniref:serine/threonine protein kinase n=1 Tax=Pseudobutyrivibrio sp. TaxID=2014367 RepID=UPI0025F27D0E|nr:serine/threonine-protein kinase [Pseudobutyrivibrio sp.]MBR5649633.1 serine/threonine protein kinase [Pseudobutyrivibrio sp.]
MLKIGSVVDNKYKILNEIGHGGMSTVYLAMNERANKQWAIKEIRKEKFANEDIVYDSIRSETELLKNLSHPNLPSIIDIIDYEGSILIVMDYIEGNTLRKALEEYGPQPQEYVIQWAKQLCDVLGYLHSQNPPIIYRDLKPSNIMLKPDGTIVLIDFGTARRFNTENNEDTTCLGTRGYAAPEQFGGYGQTDARTDIYCFGTTIYHLLTGKNPSEPPYEIYPIRYWDESFSQGLEKIIIKCTQADPNRRYQNAYSLLYDLEHYDELDSEYRRKEKIKLISFILVVVLCIANAIGAATCHFYGKHVQTNAYENYLVDAEKGQSLDDMREAYIESISINPEEADAYIRLIERVYLEDNVFSEDEASEIRGILINQSNGHTYEELLQKNKLGYEMFSYQLGLAYFYNYEGTGNKQLSAYWLKKAAEGELPESQTARAARLGAIADYYTSLGMMDKTGDSKVSFKDYWADLTSVSEGNIVKDDNATTALVIYKEVASQICVYADRFNRDGVSYGEMELALIEIENHVQDDIEKAKVEKTDRIVELEAELEKNIEKARQVISLNKQEISK